MLDLLITLLVAVLICGIIAFVCWGILAILSMFPIPEPPKSIIRVVVWVVCGIACLLVLIYALRGDLGTLLMLNVVRGTVPGLP